MSSWMRASRSRRRRGRRRRGEPPLHRHSKAAQSRARWGAGLAGPAPLRTANTLAALASTLCILLRHTGTRRADPALRPVPRQPMPHQS